MTLICRHFAGGTTGKTVVSKFPDRSAVIYSEKQKLERRRFADAVSFARVVIADQGLKQSYSIKAAVLGFRSAWNIAIAEYMSDQLLKVKKKKIRFDRSQIQYPADSKLQIKLFKTIEAEPPGLIGIGLTHKLLFTLGRKQRSGLVGYSEMRLYDLNYNLYTFAPQKFCGLDTCH